MGSPLNVALLGFGLSGRYLQAPFYRAHAGFRVSHVVSSRTGEIAEDFPGMVPTGSVEEALTDPAVDLISIATPNPTHYVYARAALEAGKHVLIDKPACAAAAELRELRDLAARKRRHLFVFQNRRWDSDFLTVREVLKAKQLGTLVSYEARYDRYKPAPNPKQWKETPGPTAGMLYDLGSHLIDQAICLFGRPQRVSGSTWTERPDADIADAFRIELVYDNPLRVHLSCSLLVREPTPRYRLHGRRGSFVKYGIDVQEDQLRAGMAPGDAGFGEEPEVQQGILHTEMSGLVSRGHLATLPGHWLKLFDNMHAVITQGAIPAVPLDDIALQLEIMASMA